MKYKQFNLPYGARLMYAKNDINQSTIVDISFLGGASEEKIPGLAHFTEHMFFSGTDKLSAEEVKKKFFYFSQANAYTTYRDIVFTGGIFTDELAQFLSTVAMVIKDTTFSNEAIENEKKIVIQEINAFKDDNRSNFYNINYSNMYDRDLLNKGVIGNEKSVKSIKQKDILEFVNKYFVANNADIFICTPLSVREVKKLVIENLLNKIKILDDYKKTNMFYLNAVDFNFYKSVYKDIGKIYIGIDFRVKHTIFDIDFFIKEKLISRMINDISYGLTKLLRQDKSLVYYADYTLLYENTGSIVQIITESDKNNANQIIEAVAEYIKGLKEKGFSSEQLEKAKRMIKFARESRIHSPNKYLDKLYNFRIYGKVLDSEYIHKKIMDTTLEECNALINEIFDVSNIGCTLYGDVKKKDIMSEKKFFKLFRS